MLPAEVAERMVREIPNARQVDLKDIFHYSILFQPNEKRAQAILNFIKT
jgi:hypothetical protein